MGRNRRSTTIPGRSMVYSYGHNHSPIALANRHLAQLFGGDNHEHVLCLPNDVICPPNLYRKMLERPEGIVAAGMHGANPPVVMEEVKRVHGDVHMSAVLIRKSAYDALVAQDGYFLDEGFFAR